MVSIARKFKNQMTKKVFSCPNCHKQLRVPIRPGKTLLVNCPKCQGQVQLSFKNPLTEFFHWEKGRTLKYNLNLLKWRFLGLPFSVKLIFIIQLIIFASLIQYTISYIKAPGENSMKTNPIQSEIVRKI